MSDGNMDFMSELEADIELFKQKVSLEEKYKEEVEFYKNMLMQQRNSCDDSDFLIMSTEFDEDSIDIIGQHIRQIGEIVYENGFLLATRQECDRNYGIYLRQLHDHVDMAKTVKIIEQFVEEKRENFVKTRDWPVDMVAPQFQYVTFLVEKEKKLLEQQANRHSEALNEKIREMRRDISRVIAESKRYRQKTQEYEQKIKEMEEKKKVEKLLKKFNKRVGIPHNPTIGFHNEKNFEITLKSPVILDGLAERLSKKEEGDYSTFHPPLKNIHSLEERRKEVIGYIEYVRINWNNYCSATTIQQNIHGWFLFNWQPFLYYPSEEEKEISRKMFLNKFKLENTIGTIHFLSIQYHNCTKYFCFAISNYKIIRSVSCDSQQQAYSNVYNNLKYQPTWTQNTKFATEMAVSNEQSDRFIQTSNKDVFVENEKVVTWIKNNFNLEQQSNKCIGYATILPTIYNFIINFYKPPFFE